MNRRPRERASIIAAVCVAILVVLLPVGLSAQTEDTWPPLNYLRSDFKSVRVVAHVRIRESEIVNKIPGYDNWRIVAEVVEPFKGKFRKGEVIEYFHGAEAPSKKSFSPARRSSFCSPSTTKRRKRCGIRSWRTRPSRLLQTA